MQTAHGGANTGNHARAANGTTALARRLPAAAEYDATARRPPAPPPRGAQFLVHAALSLPPSFSGWLASYGRSTPLPFSMIICCQSTIESDFFPVFFLFVVVSTARQMLCLCCQPALYCCHWTAEPPPAPSCLLPFVHRTPPLAAAAIAASG